MDKAKFMRDYALAKGKSTESVTRTTHYNGVFITYCPTRKAKGYSPKFASRKSTRSAALQAGNTSNTLLAARDLQREVNQYGPRSVVLASPRVIVRKKVG